MDETRAQTPVDEPHDRERPSVVEATGKPSVGRPVSTSRFRQRNATGGSSARRSASARICSGTRRRPSVRRPPGPVLLVDDDPSLLQAVKLGLESHGYQVVTAHDGREGLDLLRHRHPCLVLLDLEMPGMNGWQFREEQRADPSIASVPVVVVSSRTDADRQARAMHVAGGLQKPVDLEELTATVRAQCATA